MSERTEFSCNVCGFKIGSWSDGHPYLVDGSGERHFFPTLEVTISPANFSSRRQGV